MSDGTIETFGDQPRRLNRQLVTAMVKSGIVGFVMVLLLTSVLYETSVNAWFAALNGIALMLMAAAMYGDLGSATANAAPMMGIVVRMGMVITIIAAFGTYIIRFAKLGAFLDLSFIVTTACGNCYCLCYVLVALYNKRQQSQFVARQIYTMAAAAILVGGVSGFVFAAVDVEDHVRRLGWEQWVCAMVGFLGGAFIGHANYHATDESMVITFEGLEMDDDV